MPEVSATNPTRKSLRNVHYAILNSDTSEAVNYSAPVRLVGGISASVSPSTNAETLHADDGLIDQANDFAQVEVELALAVLPLSAQADLLGHSYNVNTGILSKKSTDEAPYVALGFMSQETQDRIMCNWLYKGKFSLIEEEFATKGDTPDWKKPKIKGVFTRRVFDNKYQDEADTSSPNFTATNVTEWFNAVPTT